MSKFKLDLSGPVLKLYMGWKIPFSMSRNRRVLRCRQCVILSMILLLGIQRRKTEGLFRYGKGYGE